MPASAYLSLKAFIPINENVARWYTAYIIIQRSYERV